MHEDNPYRSPHNTPPLVTTDTAGDDASPALETRGTVLPRHIAAILDNFVAVVLGVVAAKSMPQNQPMLQFLALIATYFNYYFLSEGLFSRSPGKLLTGLVVVQVDGTRCTWRQTLIRTCFRALEVNPALLGGLPAAICIIASRHHQRIGDRLAGTVVVPSHSLRKSSQPIA